MQYHCVQCDELFTLDASDDKPRCPKCLRQHGLRAIDAPKPSAARRPWWFALAGLVLVAAAAGGYAYYRAGHGHPPGKVPLEPIDAAAVRRDVRALAGIDAGDLAQLLTADSKLESFAEAAVKGQSSPAAKAKAVCAALQARKHKQAYVAWSRADPRESPPLTASGAWAAIARDGARAQLYPLELAAVAVAALRTQSVDAMVAEVYRYPNERTALDPSGRLGYHVAYVPGRAGAAATFCDPYGGRSQAPQKADYTVLNDAQAVGAALAIRALQRYDSAGDSTAGLADSQAAVKLLPRSASARSARAAVLLATGGVDAGSRELQAAAQLRSDAARHNNLAVLALVGNDVDRAAKEVAAALSELPDYALAHLTLASVHLSRGERDLARAELEKAERLEPELALLPQVWAEFYASGGDMTQALAKAQEAVRRRPHDTKALLVLARVDRAAGRYDDMRKQAQAILKRTSEADRDRMKTALRAVLGPTVFEPSADEAQPDSKPEPGAVSLSQPGTDGDQGPHLLEHEPEAKPGALKLGSQPPQLRLDGVGKGLKLHLNP